MGYTFRGNIQYEAVNFLGWGVRGGAADSRSREGLQPDFSSGQTRRSGYAQLGCHRYYSVSGTHASVRLGQDLHVPIACTVFTAKAYMLVMLVTNWPVRH